MFSSFSTIPLLLICCLAIQWLRSIHANPKRLPYPPGPKPLPFIGNALEMPTSYHWLGFTKWAKEYGDIVHVQAFGKHVVILNSIEAVEDLLEQKSAIYSDRPRFPLLVELMGWNWLVPLLPYGANWRRKHRIFHEYFHSQIIAKYRPVHFREATRLLGRLLVSPEDFKKHVHQVFTGTIVNIVYGIDLKSSNHPYTEVAEKALHAVTIAGIPGSFLVDTFPILKYVPDWFPGARFKKLAKHARNLLPPFVDEPFNTAKRDSLSETAKPCLVSSALESRVGEDIEAEYEIDVRDVAATAFAGGSDTTRSTIQVLILALALHPHSQRRAQEQLDNVVGHERLPDFDDITRCPLVYAILMEALRWQPVLPIAAPHAVTQDDEYRGYYIPKGSVVFGNSWAILHDENVYPDPHAFLPERFLNEDGSFNHALQSPAVAVFGYGRRKCPGRHFALEGALIAVASILSCFDITRSLEDKADYLVNDPTKPFMSSGLASYPFPYRCSIRPRSKSAVSIIKQALQRLEDET